MTFVIEFWIDRAFENYQLRNAATEYIILYSQLTYETFLVKQTHDAAAKVETTYLYEQLREWEMHNKM